MCQWDMYLKCLAFKKMTAITAVINWWLAELGLTQACLVPCPHGCPSGELNVTSTGLLVTKGWVVTQMGRQHHCLFPSTDGQAPYASQLTAKDPHIPIPVGDPEIKGMFLPFWGKVESFQAPFRSLSPSCVLSRFSHVWIFVILWTVTHQAPVSMGFSRR